MNIPKRAASIWLIGLLLLVAACIPASAAPGTLTVSRTAVSFPSTNYGTYSFSIVKQAGTTVTLFCIEPELDSISTTKTYTNQGVLTQAVIDGITWSHNNGTVNGYGKPTANQIYSILWHAVNTEGLTLNNLTNWQQGGIQMAIKHWRQSTAWGVKATAGTDAAKAFDLAKRLQASARTDVKTMQTTRASVAVSAPTEVMTRSSNTYTIATWRVSGTYDSYTVAKDASCTSGVYLSQSGSTITAFIPASKMTGAVQVAFTVTATKAISQLNYFTATGSQTMGMFVAETSTAAAVGRYRNENEQGKIEIYKSGDDGAKLSGAKFAVVNQATGQPYSLSTNSDGYASLTGLPLGRYTVTETVFPDGYGAGENQTVWEVEITSAQSTVTIRAVNERLRGSLRVVKQDRSDALRAGAVYLLEIAQNGGSWQPVTAAECSSAGLTDGTLTAGVDGTVCFDGLPADPAICYRLTEIRAPEGCSLPAEPLFTGSLPAEEISLTAVDDLVPVLPMTGRNDLWLPAVGILAASAALWLLCRCQSVPKAQA